MGARALLRRIWGRVVDRRRPTGAATASPTLPPPAADGFVAVAREVMEGRPLQTRVHSAAIAVYRVGDRLYAIDAACLHEDGPVGEGPQDGAIATCPYHDWRYDVRDGRCLSQPGRALGTFPVVARDGWVWVGPRATASSGERGGAHADGLRSRRASP